MYKQTNEWINLTTGVVESTNESNIGGSDAYL